MVSGRSKGGIKLYIELKKHKLDHIAARNMKSVQQQTTNLAPDLNSVKNLWRHEATSDEPRFAVVSLHKNVYPLLLMQS